MGPEARRVFGFRFSVFGPEWQGAVCVRDESTAGVLRLVKSKGAGFQKKK